MRSTRDRPAAYGYLLKRIVDNTEHDCYTGKPVDSVAGDLARWVPALVPSAVVLLRGTLKPWHQTRTLIGTR